MVAEDTAQTRGVGTISTLLSNEGMLLPRDFIRKTLSTYAPDGLSHRFPGANRVRRSALVAIGPNHQHHADGHEKLNAQALGMGGVGLNIYGIKDQWSSFLLHLVVLPNNRLASTIGHVYLDCVKKYGAVCITFIVDKGSETGYIYAHQTGLRETYAPDIDSDQFPPAQHVRSVHNTPIEGLWHWFVTLFGIDIKEVIQQGKVTGVYNPGNPIHPQLFNWIWPQILQHQLDKFVEYWNNHKIWYQSTKPNMSGQTPRHVFMVPQAPAEDCCIEVPQDAVDALCNTIPVSRDEAMRWVDPSFEEAARRAYITIGSPSLSNMSTGWSIFSAMAAVITL
ncbi:uncharacterized protein LACBIDRAFT_318159 [Laccaria bicolor S238N-H82]|uniref:Predicted protein n=1 Tax=Laccaria bicolor (strain S238N-H82 / ATCC MYA-4686) TaxID=486041 RepID=B0D647_LACBS|nr:uncharacterized protein LACBIDRAFT_318159 [Laccaria bicolor S238N-H82]EDR10136.1 predicted protein [Laccaria bicolor S238N-H82]|eukprot:XP_001879521.1 predicted protein [Laccaria bicolor S238N-H82]